METKPDGGSTPTANPHSELAQSVIDSFDTVFAGRGRTTGFKKWELILVYKAYEVLGTPKAERHYGLAGVKDVADLNQQFKDWKIGRHW